MKNKIYIIHENDEWIEPLRKELKNINEDQWRKESEELKKYIFEITNFI